MSVGAEKALLKDCFYLPKAFLHIFGPKEKVIFTPKSTDRFTLQIIIVSPGGEWHRLTLLSPVTPAFNHEYMIEYAKITYRKLYEYSKLTKYINPMSADTLYGTCVGTGIQDTCSETAY